MIQFADILGQSLPLFTVAGRRVHPLDDSDAPALQRLFDRCGDYFELLEGRPARPDAALEELHAGPPGRMPHDLFPLGIDGGQGELAGFIGALRHHPQPNQWYLGFLLLDPAWRGRGIGSTTYWAFQHWIAAQGAESLLLAVLADNERGRRFWQSLGFGSPRSYPARRIGLKRHVLIEYEKDLM
jgi:ribosomal protein S18 acetylase RimI-like enzyme